MTIIIVTGLIRSGKDQVAEYISKNYGYQHLDVNRDAITEEMKKRGLEPTKNNMTKLCEELQDKGFQGQLMRAIMKKIKQERVVISGCRNPTQVDYARNEYPGQVILLEVWAPSKTRYERRQAGDPEAEEEFFYRDKADIEKMQFNRVLEMADYRINNNNTIKELHKKIDEFMETLK